MVGKPIATTVVVAGGDPPNRRVLEVLPPPARCRIIAADHGADTALALGLAPNLIVGDLDSVSPATLQWAETGGVPVERHRVDKDQTDLELAMAVAAESGGEVVVIGIGGGRLDHHLANLLLLAAPAFASASITAYDGTAKITVIRGERSLTGPVRSTVSLLAIGGQAHSVTTTGLRYRLQDGSLDPTASLGVSNVLEATSATVAVGSGVVLALQPEALASEPAGTGRGA